MTFLLGSVPMTNEEFWKLPRILGWKYEYYDGRAHIQPRGCPVAALLPLSESPPPCPMVVPVADFAGLEALFVAAFTGTVDYAGFSPEQMEERARSSLKSHLDGRRGEPRPESRVFLQEGRAVGAALIVQKAHGPHLDMIIVRPEVRRAGVASALLSQVVRSLLEEGEKYLTSAYHLSNEPSRSWHRRMGFKEIPDEYAEQMKANHRMWKEGYRNKKPRPTKEQIWLRELAGELGRDAALTLDTILVPGKRGKVRFPHWLETI